MPPPDDRPAAPPATRPVLVWDLPTRLFHWTLASLVAISWVSGTQGRFDVHFWSGYAILALVGYRIAWGFVGSRTARFAGFVKGPRAVLRHAAGMLDRSGRHPVELGHNPLGALMVVALLAVLLVQAGSGLFTSDDILTDGPLVAAAGSATVSAASTLHRTLIDYLLVLAAVHVLAVLAHRVLQGEDLIGPMITGTKEVPADQAASDPPRVHPGVALAILAGTAALVAAILRAA